MSELALDTRQQDTRRQRAGRTLARTHELRKHLATAFGESVQRASQRARGIYPQLDVAYSMVEKLARYDRTTSTPIGSDLISYGTEVAFGELETPALLRELAIRMQPLRDGAEAALEVVGILNLLAERGVLPEVGGGAR
jgi:hypothetical protein